MNTCALLAVIALVVWIWWPMGLCLWLEYVARPTKNPYAEPPPPPRPAMWSCGPTNLQQALEIAVRRHPELAPEMTNLTGLLFDGPAVEEAPRTNKKTAAALPRGKTAAKVKAAPTRRRPT